MPDASAENPAAAPADADASEIRARVLPAYPGWESAAVVPFGNGLINRTYLVTGAGGGRAVLQRVNPIFSPAIHQNILAVTRRLAEAGMVTPLLLPTGAGQPCLAPTGDGGGDGDGAVWRMLSYVDGATFDVVGGQAQARAAGALIARFHRALDGLDHVFVGRRVGVHDTAQHLARLEGALAAHPRHRLASEVAPLAAAIRAGAAALPALPPLPERVCHGDLKFNNVLFAGATAPASEQPVCLIDLDVVGPLSLAYELGDAWRSWCNRAGEDDPQAVLDLGDLPRVARRIPRGARARARRGGARRPAAGGRVGQPGARGALRRRRPARGLLRVGPAPVPRARRAQPGAGARAVVAAPVAGRLASRARGGAARPGRQYQLKPTMKA